MISTDYSDFKKNTKAYLNKTADGSEPVIITRKNRKKNVVIMSIGQYNKMLKAVRNSEYLAKLDRSFEQLESGMGQIHELIEVSPDE